jgi:hypothetical protein
MLIFIFVILLYLFDHFEIRMMMFFLLCDHLLEFLFLGFVLISQFLQLSVQLVHVTTISLFL